MIQRESERQTICKRYNRKFCSWPSFTSTGSTAKSNVIVTVNVSNSIGFRVGLHSVCFPHRQVGFAAKSGKKAACIFNNRELRIRTLSYLIRTLRLRVGLTQKTFVFPHKTTRYPLKGLPKYLNIYFISKILDG